MVFTKKKKNTSRKNGQQFREWVLLLKIAFFLDYCFLCFIHNFMTIVEEQSTYGGIVKGNTHIKQEGDST